MDLKILKEPAPVFVMGCVITMLFLFIETRIRGEKKPYRDYFVYGIFVGGFLSIMLYLSQNYGKTKMGNVNVGEKYLIDRFPV